MAIKWNKKKNNDEKSMPLTTLKAAYDLLGISKFPVTYDEVCTHYYIKTMDKDISKEQKDMYETAKKMILSKLSTNPYSKEISSKLESSQENIEIGLKKESVLGKIKKKALQLEHINKNKKNEEGQGRVLEKETDFILLKKKKHPSKRVVIIVLFICIMFILSINILTRRGEPAITKAESIRLLETQGVILEKNKINIKPENICCYQVQQKAYIPGFNICILERNYLLSTCNILTKVSSLTAYKAVFSETDDTMWKKVWEHTNKSIEEVKLSGTWVGSYAPEEDEKKDIILKIIQTENGYIEGTLSTIAENSISEEYTVIGKYDKEKNELSIQDLEWIKQSDPEIVLLMKGYYDYEKEAIISTDNSHSAFELKCRELNLISIFPLLLENEYASYRSNGKNHNIELGKLDQFIYTIDSQTEEVVEISYSGVTNREIINFKVKGNAVFKKEDAVFVLKNHSATAEYLSTSITGYYKGTEWIANKKYNAAYEIYLSETDEKIYADVILTKPFETIKEKRIISFEEGGIKAKRIDVLSEKVVGDGEAFALMNYEEDNFYSEENLTLSKEMNTNLLEVTIEKEYTD